MRKARVAATVIAITTGIAPAFAQPADPYTPEVREAVLNEQVALALVERALELLDARSYTDARQLANEALAKSPDGAAARQARFVIEKSNAALGVGSPVKGPSDTTPTPTPPDPMTGQPLPPNTPVPMPDDENRAFSPKEISARVHGALFLGTLGAGIGIVSSDDEKTRTGAAVAVGLGGAVIGALGTPWVVDKLGATEVQIRTVGSTSVWGGVLGAFIADAVDVDNTTATSIFGGAMIGETVGALAGIGIATQKRFTRGDIAMIDTFSGMGVVGGLTMGMLMQPAEGEAYSVNAVIGGAAGYLTGYIAGPLVDATPRRMLRVAGFSAAGGAVPFLLYAAIRSDDSHADERLTGFLSSAGLVVGAYLGFRLTRDLDEGLDKPSDAPAALVGRSSRGDWALGSLSVQPLSPVLAPQRGMAMPLISGAF